MNALTEEERLRAIQRFLDKVREDVGGHWRWCVRGRPVRRRVGACWFRLPGALGHLRVSANRAAWLLFRGPIPEGHGVFTTCGVEGCLLHLAAGTPVEARPYIEPNPRRGEAASRLLTEVEVQAVLERWNAGWTVRQLHQLVPQVSEALVAAIVGGYCWTHVLPRPVRRGRVKHEGGEDDRGQKQAADRVEL